MLRRIILVLPFALIGIVGVAMANQDVVGVPSPVLLHRYTAVMPPPFGVTTVFVDQSPSGEVRAVRVHTKGEVIDFDPDLLEGLTEFSIPQLVHKPCELRATGALSSIGLYFFFGSEFLIYFPPEHLREGDAASDWRRAIVSYTVDANLNVTRRVTDEATIRNNHPYDPIAP